MDPEESHNPESSGLDILTVTRNPSEQLSETNAEGSERENRKLNERKRVWTYGTRIGRNLTKVIKRPNFIPWASESDGVHVRSTEYVTML